jgi:hypothetical protein
MENRFSAALVPRNQCRRLDAHWLRIDGSRFRACSSTAGRRGRSRSSCGRWVRTRPSSIWLRSSAISRDTAAVGGAARRRPHDRQRGSASRRRARQARLGAAQLRVPLAMAHRPRRQPLVPIASPLPPTRLGRLDGRLRSGRRGTCQVELGFRIVGALEIVSAVPDFDLRISSSGERRRSQLIEGKVVAGTRDHRQFSQRSPFELLDRSRSESPLLAQLRSRLRAGPLPKLKGNPQSIQHTTPLSIPYRDPSLIAPAHSP